MTTTSIQTFRNRANAAVAPRGLPLLRLGLRAFFLGAAAVACIGRPLLPPAARTPLIAAAAAWCSAFALYLHVYTPWLTAARIDGKDG